MSFWRTWWAGSFPRIAVMLHDLFMVWACWQLLHVARYALLKDAPPLPLFDLDVAVVMLVFSFVLLLLINALQSWQRRTAGAQS